MRVPALALFSTALLAGCGAAVNTPRPRAPMVDTVLSGDAAPSVNDVAEPLRDSLRGLPASSAEAAARTFAARLDQLTHACSGAQVSPRNASAPGAVIADFGVGCPNVSGAVAALFVDVPEVGLVVELRFRDYWQRGSDVLRGDWTVAITKTGEARFDSPPPWRDDPVPPRPPPFLSPSPATVASQRKIESVAKASRASLDLLKIIPFAWPLAAVLPVGAALTNTSK